MSSVKKNLKIDRVLDKRILCPNRTSEKKRLHQVQQQEVQNADHIHQSKGFDLYVVPWSDQQRQAALLLWSCRQRSG